MEELKKEFYKKFSEEYKATCEHYIYLKGDATELWKWIKENFNAKLGKGGIGTHLRFNYMEAGLGCNENRHAQTVMKELGIIYQHSTPQSMGDQFWFWNCENIPKELPSYLTIADWNPMECIGHGLSKEDAEKIRDYKTKME